MSLPINERRVIYTHPHIDTNINFSQIPLLRFIEVFTNVLISLMKGRQLPIKNFVADSPIDDSNYKTYIKRKIWYSLIEEVQKRD